MCIAATIDPARPDYSKVYVWQDGPGNWAYCFPSHDWNVHDGYPSYEDALSAAEGQSMFSSKRKVSHIVHMIPDAVAEKRSQSALSSAPVSPVETDALCAVAPLKTDAATVPDHSPVMRILKVELDLLPILQDAVRQACIGTEERLEPDYGYGHQLRDYERNAVNEVNRARLNALQTLLADMSK